MLFFISNYERCHQFLLHLLVETSHFVIFLPAIAAVTILFFRMVRESECFLAQVLVSFPNIVKPYCRFTEKEAKYFCSLLSFLDFS